MTRPRFTESLSARLLLITICAILVAEVLVFLPGLARERRGWMNRHLRDAYIVAEALTRTTGGATAGGNLGGSVDGATAEHLLALSDCEMIRVREDGAILIMLGPKAPITPDLRVDHERETGATELWRSLRELFRAKARQVYLIGRVPGHPTTAVELIVDERSLLDVLRAYAGRVFGFSLLIAAITGALVYLAVAALLVRPVRRITRSIAAFRRDPERSVPLNDGQAMRAGGEIAVAGQELAALQLELREALWRNARLAALGTAMAKVSHDLRGILSAAMLAADRLASHPDLKVKQAAETMLRSVERATELVRQTLAYTRDGPPPLARGPIALRPLIEEAAEGIVGLRLALEVAPGLMVLGDRVALLRVLGNLMRNAREAGARRLGISAMQEGGLITIELADDGPGLPDTVQASLFRPFASGGRHGGTGLGLAIAGDLTRALGGEIALVSTGAAGTVFRLILPAAAPALADVKQAS